MKPVNNKTDFVRRFMAGEFGNRAPDWDSYDSLMASDYPHPSRVYSVRSRLRDWNTRTNITQDALAKVWADAASEVGGESNLYISATPPDHRLILQGDVWQDVGGLSAYLTRVRAPMKTALKQESFSVSGLAATAVCKSAMCPNSWDWLNELLTRYLGHVIEFTTFECQWGTVPRFNTVIWECRNY